MNTERRVRDWLCALPHVISATPVRVTIGRTTYEGARYTSRLTSARDGTPYESEMIYLCGELPAAYRRRRKTCFRFSGDSRDWYVACYAPAYVASDLRVSEFHPFGPTFSLAPWQVPCGEAIDHWEEKPYTRVIAHIEEDRR